MSWQHFIGISIFFEVIGRLTQRIVMKDKGSDPIPFVILYQLIGGVIIGAFALYNGFRIPDLSPIILNLLAVFVLYGIGNILIFKSLKLTDASVFTVLFSSRIFWIVGGAIIFLNEKFLWIQFLGAILIIIGVIIVSWKKQKIALHRGEIYAILGALVFSVAIINEAIILRTFDVLSYSSIAFIVPAFLVWVINPGKSKDVFKLLKSRRVVKVVMLSILYSVSSLAYLYAYKIGDNAAQIGSISQISVVIIVLLSIFLLNERSNKLLKIVASILSFVGVLLVG